MEKELYQLSVKITFEAAADNIMLDILKKHIFDRFKKETLLNESEYFYYFTFIGEDYRQNIIHLTVRNRDTGYFIASMPKDEYTVREAVRYLRKINSHLVFKETFVGLDGNDFVYERVSVKLSYIKKITKNLDIK